MTGSTADNARQTFVAMSAAERRNLAKLAYWLAPDYQRRPGDHLIGPEYDALRRIGLIDTHHESVAAGNVVEITDLGRAVLHYVEGGV